MKASKKLKIIIIVLIFSTLLIASVLYSQNVTIEMASNESDQSSSTLENPVIETINLSEEEFNKYAQVYKDPYVIFLRERFDAALDNNEDLGIDNYKEYFESKFVVYNMTDSIAGGKDILIIFQDKPDKIFYAWVYKPVGTEDYELRGFNARENNEEELKELVGYIQPLLSNKNLAL